MLSQRKPYIPPKITKALVAGIQESPRALQLGFMGISCSRHGGKAHSRPGIVYAEAQKVKNACHVQKIENLR